MLRGASDVEVIARQIEMWYSSGGIVQYIQTVWISHNMGFDPIFLFNDLDDKGGML